MIDYGLINGEFGYLQEFFRVLIYGYADGGNKIHDRKEVRRIGVYIAFIITIVAVVCDIKWWSIPNRLIVVGLICGVLCNITERGISGGIKQFALGAVTPVAWLVILFLIRGMGAGDIKLFAVIGGLMGQGITEIVIYSIFAGGVIGLFGYLIKKVRRIHFSLAVMAGMVIYCFGIVGANAAV